MNTTVVPDNASWELKIDSGVRDVALATWDDATHLRIASGPGAQPLIDVTLELLLADPNLISTLSKQVQPFGPETIPDG